MTSVEPGGARSGAGMSEHVSSIICPGMIEVNAALLNGTYQIGNWDSIPWVCRLQSGYLSGAPLCSALEPYPKEGTNILIPEAHCRPLP
ncbi:hypothetical protein BDR03DRAFT_938992 [Suillus americanus]|nr:hypothetical protein BDR03DRAFT_938992 [Suillus americanus]